MGSRHYVCPILTLCYFFFFFNDTATTEIYTLSLHDALPIYIGRGEVCIREWPARIRKWTDRKSTRLNSSHLVISYAVFCLKKKKQQHRTAPYPTPVRPHALTADTPTTH